MTDLLKIAENLAAAGLDHPAVDDAVIKLTNAVGQNEAAGGVVADCAPIGYMDPNAEFLLPKPDGCVLSAHIDLLLVRDPHGKHTTPLYTHPARGVVDEVVRELVIIANDGDEAGYGYVADKLRELSSRLQAAQPADQHPDDAAVDRFAAAMKEKLAAARAKGRGGWDEPGLQQRLSDMLRDHVGKGDPRDVANFACFLWNRGEGIAPREAGQGVDDPIVGHKTHADEAGRFYHAPLHQSEADALIAHIEAERLTRERLMPDEQTAINLMWAAWYRLKDFGWKEPSYCPKDGTPFEVIENGSTGIHQTMWHGPWPGGWCVEVSSPALWRPIATHTQEGRG